MASFLSEKRIFRLHKTENLDWKKIASIDIEKVIQETDQETLKIILPQIAFCQPEVEFDHNKTDPGFRKVFKLSQLIIEHLLESHEQISEKIKSLDDKNSQLFSNQKQNQQEIQNLRDKLIEAKKELKRRKQMIESNQNEIQGENNKDEFDQCPYCKKKFINSIYLYSHLQRRHQGLPFPVNFTLPNQQSTNSILPIPNLMDSIPKTIEPMKICIPSEKVTISVQTNETGESWKGIDHQTVNDLVEQYLNQRIIRTPTEDYLQTTTIQKPFSTNSNYQILLPVGTNNNNISTGNVSITARSEGEESVVVVDKKSLGDMKEELETQWTNLMEKMHKTELEDLKSTLLDEMHKMQEIIIKSTTKVPEVQSNLTKSQATSMSPSTVTVGRVEERFQKQEDDLEDLKQNLQSKIRSDIQVIESRLESQERFWRAKMRLIENEYQQHIEKLRQEFQTSCQKNQDYIQLVQVQEHNSLNRATNVKWVPDGTLVDYYKPSTNNNGSPNYEEDNKLDEFLAVFPQPTIARPVPKPKPRVSKFSPQKIILEKETPIKSSTPKKQSTPQKQLLIQSQGQHRFQVKGQDYQRNTPVKLPIPLVTLPTNHEYEEPNDIQKDEIEQYSTTDEDEDDSKINSTSASSRTYSIIPGMSSVPQSVIQKSKLTKQKFSQDTDTNTNTSIETQKSGKVTKGNTNLVANQPRTEVLDELSRNLKELGINPEATGLSRKDMKKSLKKVQTRRRSFSEKVENFSKEREVLKEHTNQVTNVKIQQAKAAAINENRRFSYRPIGGTTGTSPLVKMFRAVKTGGSSLKRKMSFMTNKRPNGKTSPRNRSKITTTAAYVSDTSKPGPSRKSIAPLPPTAPVVATKKKTPKIKTFFRRPWGSNKKLDQSESEVDNVDEDDDEPVMPMLKKSRPIAFNTTPIKAHRQQLEIENINSNSSTPPLQGQAALESTTHPKRLLQLHNREVKLRDNMEILRKAEKEISLSAEMQRRAEKEIKLSIKGVIPKMLQSDSPSPGPYSKVKKQFNRSLSREFEGTLLRTNFTKSNFKESNFPSSTIDHEKNQVEFSTSATSMTSDSGEETENQSVELAQNQDEENVGNYVTLEVAKPVTVSKVTTLIYNDPWKGLNAFGLKPINNYSENENPTHDDSLHTSIASSGGSQKRRKGGVREPIRSKSSSISSRSKRMKASTNRSKSQIHIQKTLPTKRVTRGRRDDGLNNPSDWDTTISEKLPPVKHSPGKKVIPKTTVSLVTQKVKTPHTVVSAGRTKKSLITTTKPNWSIPGPNPKKVSIIHDLDTKSRDNSWDF